MPILDAVLAFAITMLLVATAATQLVNLLINTASMKAGEMKKLLTHCFNEEIAPVIELETKRLATTVGDQILTELNEVASRFSHDELLAVVQAEKTTFISTEEYIDYLKQTDLGKSLLEKLGNEASKVLDELGRRYETVGRKFSEEFKKHSRVWATVMACGLAVTLNVDSIHVAGAYLDDPALRGRVVAQAEAIMEKYVTAAPQATTVSPGSAEDFQQSLQAARNEIDMIKSASLPIGWGQFPHAQLFFGEANDVSVDKLNDSWRWFTWVLGVILTGILAGLGSPFWYEVVRGVTRLAQRTGGPRTSGR